MGRFTYCLEPAVPERSSVLPANLAFAAAAVARASWASKERGDSGYDATQPSDERPELITNDPFTMSSSSNYRAASDPVPRPLLAAEPTQLTQENSAYGQPAPNGSNSPSPHIIPRNSVVFHTAHEDHLTSTTLLPPSTAAPSAVAVASMLESRRERVHPSESPKGTSQGQLMSFPPQRERRRTSDIHYSRLSVERPGSSMLDADGVPTADRSSINGGRRDSDMSLRNRPTYKGRSVLLSDTVFGSVGGGGSVLRWSDLVEEAEEGDDQGDELDDAPGTSGDDGDGERDGCLVLPVLRTLLALQGETPAPTASSSGKAGGTGGGGGGAGPGRQHGAASSQQSGGFNSVLSRQLSQTMHRSTSSAAPYGPSTSTVGVVGGGAGGGGGSLSRQASNAANAVARRRALAGGGGPGDASLHGSSGGGGGGPHRLRQSRSRSFYSFVPTASTAGPDDESDLEPLSRAMSYATGTSAAAAGAGAASGTSAVRSLPSSHNPTKRALTATGFVMAAEVPLERHGNVAAATAAFFGAPSNAADVRDPAAPGPSSPPQQCHSGSGARPVAATATAAAAAGRVPQPPPGDSPKRLFSWTKNLTASGKWLWSGAGAGSGAGSPAAAAVGAAAPPTIAGPAASLAAENGAAGFMRHSFDASLHGKGFRSVHGGSTFTAAGGGGGGGGQRVSGGGAASPGGVSATPSLQPSPQPAASQPPAGQLQQQQQPPAPLTLQQQQQQLQYLVQSQQAYVSSGAVSVRVNQLLQLPPIDAPAAAAAATVKLDKRPAAARGSNGGAAPAAAGVHASASAGDLSVRNGGARVKR